jgi:ACT domain-containing protein
MAKVASKNAKVKDLKASAEAKNWTKVIKAVRSSKTGAYTFKDAIIHKEKVKDFLSEK